MKISHAATTVGAIDLILGRYGLSELARAPPPRAGSPQLWVRTNGGTPRAVIRDQLDARLHIGRPSIAGGRLV